MEGPQYFWSPCRGRMVDRRHPSHWVRGNSPECIWVRVEIPRRVRLWRLASWWLSNFSNATPQATRLRGTEFFGFVARPWKPQRHVGADWEKEHWSGCM